MSRIVELIYNYLSHEAIPELLSALREYAVRTSRFPAFRN